MKTAKISFFEFLLTAACLALVIYSVALAASGALDPAFSGDGKVVLSFGGKYHRGWDIAVQPDGRVVVVGEKILASGGTDFAVARFNPNGSLDTTFGGDGRQTINFGAIDQALGVALQTDGKIVVAGQTSGADYMADVAVARLNKNGTLDPGFGGDGRVTTDFNGSDNGGFDVALQQGKIVVAGYVYLQDGTGYNGAVYRYNANGTPDSTFSQDGILPIDFGGSEIFNGVLVSSGKIYAAGYSQGGSTAYDFAVARLDANGTLDTSFSGDGKVKTNLGAIDVANALAVSGGKVIVVGSSGPHLAVVQYTAAGALDKTFSGDGKFKTPLGSVAEGVAVQSGKITMAGRNALGDAVLARLTSAGQPDAAFGAGGIITADWGGGDRYRSVVVKNNRIYVVGTTRDAANKDYRILVARYLN